MQVRYDEGVAIRIGPEPCVGTREGAGEASAGERIGQPLSRESRLFRVPTRFIRGRQHGRVRHRERPSDPAWSETLACADAPCAGTGRSRVWPAAARRWSASGRRGAVADDARTREVRLRHSSDEAGEQSRATGRGAGGAKGGDQGEREPATARAGRRTGKACHRRWTAYGKPQGNGRRRGSPRSSTTSRSTCCGWRSSRSSETPRPAWTA